VFIIDRGDGSTVRTGEVSTEAACALAEILAEADEPREQNW
jgi:hypothetical protein